MNDQYFNFNFPTQSTGTTMNCENIHCTKGLNYTTRTTIPPSMCTQCHKLYCYSCFQTKQHQCQKKNTIFSDFIDVVPNCSRCKIRGSTRMCIKCNSQYFCQECCRIVHSIKKFSFHPVTTINCVQIDSRSKTLNYQQRQQHSVKSMNLKVRQHYHKKSPSYVQLELLNLNTNVQQQNINKFLCQQQSLINNSKAQLPINNLQTLNSKVQLSMSLIGLKKSQIKLSQMSVKQKYQRLTSSIQSTFKIILQKLHQKQQSIKLFIQKQLQTTMKQIASTNSKLKQLQIETNNIKLLIDKNAKKTSRSSITPNNNSNDSLMMVKFINQKFLKNQSKINAISNSNSLPLIVDKKIQLSKQFSQTFKRIQNEIDLLKAQNLFNEQQKSTLIVRNFDQTSLGSNHKERKKPLAINTSTKYNKKADTINTLTTSKKHLNNISFSHQLNNTTNQHMMVSVKNNKKRKTSIELYETGVNHYHQLQGKELQGSEKMKELQRIKSFDFLSSTVASLSSSSQIKTEKKVIGGGIKKQLQLTNKINNNNNINCNNKINKNNLNLSINININDDDINDNGNKNNLGELKLDSKRHTSSTQQLSFSFIRNKINDTSLVEEVQSLNFLTTSSQLLPSIENLPDIQVIETTRPKPTLHYGAINSPKSSLNLHSNNIHNKQRIHTHNNNSHNINNNSNKTFSGTTLKSSIKSPTNKIITSAFKSPKVKYRYANQKKQQPTSFNHLSSQFDNNVGIGSCIKQQRNTIKKITSNRVLTSANKE